MRTVAFSVLAIALLATVPAGAADEAAADCPIQAHPGATEIADRYYMTSHQEGTARGWTFTLWSETNDFDGLQTSVVYCDSGAELPGDHKIGTVGPGIVV